MVRIALCAAALASLCSAASAERIYIEAGSMTLFTATNEVEVKLWFRTPPEFDSTANNGYALIGGTLPLRNGQSEWFTIDNSAGGGRTDDEFHILHYLGDRNWNVVRESNMGTMDYVLDGRLLTAMIPLEQLGMTAVPFHWNAYGQGNDEPIAGPLSIDDRVLHTPEPSTLMLVAAAHLLWLPRLRQRFGKRHISR